MGKDNPASTLLVIYVDLVFVRAVPIRMMINHCTLDYHVNNFDTFSRVRLKQTNQNHASLLNSDPNLKDKFGLLPYMAMLRDVT